MRWLFLAVVVLFCIWMFQRNAQASRERSKTTCEVDLATSQRELEAAQKAVEVDSRQRDAEARKVADGATVKLQAELNSCISENKSQKTLYEQQITTMKELTTSQIAALQAFPDKQAAALGEQMKSWQDGCKQLLERTEALGLAKTEECARAAESVVLVCRSGPKK